MASLLADAFGAPRLLVGAREAGAGSLIARLLNGRPADDTLLALLESPADRYFEDHADQVRKRPGASATAGAEVAGDSSGDRIGAHA